MYRHSAALFCLFTLVSSPAIAAQIPVIAGMRLSSAARIRSGEYRLADAGKGIVQVSGTGFEIDFGGAKIIGPGRGEGVGIHVTDARNVTIRNADVSGCSWGIVVERSAGVKLIGCRTSGNNDLKPGTTIDESGREPEDQWGGGVLLRDCRDCLAQRCESQHQWDGIDVVRSAGCLIEDGDYSFNGNWGLHLWDSSHNTFRRNRAVWCTTGSGKLYQALTGWQTYDSQAVGIDHNSCDNLIEGNDLRFGGDAIFIRANEGPITPGTAVPPRNGSHRNILRDNDCSFSPNNAIEVDFVDDTVIENNNCSNSHYGMWLGYSRRCVVRGNTCVNDSAHAVEIENGQDDLFERNVFGFDVRRPDGQLVVLRQNGHDRTPSQGYKLRGNLFYGAGRGIRLTNTEIVIEGSAFVPIDDRGRLVESDDISRVTESGTEQRVPDTAPRPAFLMPLKRPVALVPGRITVIAVPGARADLPPPVIELNGIPAWVRGVGAEGVSFSVPPGFWDRPAPDTVQITAFAGVTMSQPITCTPAWPPGLPRITSVSPNPAKIGDTIEIAGMHLDGGRLLLNGKPLASRPAKDASITGSPVRGVVALPVHTSRMRFALPPGILVPTSFNLIWERGSGGTRTQTWPITLAVGVAREQMPHLLSAIFEPATLRVGELLKVTMTLHNNLPAEALLTMSPKPPFTYEERQAAYDMGLNEQEGKLHLRVTSDNTAPHNPGSWPYLFGFDRPALAAGESITVTGYIKMEHPGEREFRVGLVAGGFRFIDDNAFRTKIHVNP